MYISTEIGACRLMHLGSTLPLYTSTSPILVQHYIFIATIHDNTAFSSTMYSTRYKYRREKSPTINAYINEREQSSGHMPPLLLTALVRTCSCRSSSSSRTPWLRPRLDCMEHNAVEIFSSMLEISEICSTYTLLLGPTPTMAPGLCSG